MHFKQHKDNPTQVPLNNSSNHIDTSNTNGSARAVVVRYLLLFIIYFGTVNLSAHRLFGLVANPTEDCFSMSPGLVLKDIFEDGGAF